MKSKQDDLKNILKKLLTKNPMKPQDLFTQINASKKSIYNAKKNLNIESVLIEGNTYWKYKAEPLEEFLYEVFWVSADEFKEKLTHAGFDWEENQEKLIELGLRKKENGYFWKKNK